MMKRKGEKERKEGRGEGRSTGRDATTGKASARLIIIWGKLFCYPFQPFGEECFLDLEGGTEWLIN
jgi:hypothetical protein